MNLVIRHATEADARVLSEIARKIFIDTFAADNRTEDIELHVARSYSEEIQLREIADKSKTYLLAEVEGSVVGFAFVGKSESAACAELESPIELFRFYVGGEWHGRGIAQRLMNAVEETARSLGGRTVCLAVWEHNPRAIRFYEKVGFIDAGSQPFLLGGDMQTDRVMVKEIASIESRGYRR
ncbi:MAG TPA: GNAT family N-acetyltransferase [Gemmatimonadaceae bacterium]|nr:GNAT family N-acetyltransferase [Gemmatimonadaceae bacterium]